MITEILAIAGVGIGAFTVADHENWLGGNPLKQFWWERPPFVPVPVAPTRFQNRFTPLTSEQRVQQGQQALANATRMIDQAARQQLAETRLPLGQSKYVLTS